MERRREEAKKGGESGRRKKDKGKWKRKVTGVMEGQISDKIV
jgi:hypothetical protein